MSDVEEQPDDSEPTPERQAQLKAAYERNQHGPGNFYQRVFAIRTRGELDWLMRDQGWSGDIDDRRASRVQLSGVSFQRANLHDAHLYMAVLQDASFLGADLSGAILIGAHLLDTNFTGANLAGAHLVGAYLTHANLHGASLRGANLRHADLSFARLRDADLSGADLFGVDLTHADLSGAHLQGVDLRSRRFDEQTNLNGILVDGETRWDYRMRHLGENAATE
jgi:uncharacterized protein YjbI with pentapeptide repeats